MALKISKTVEPKEKTNINEWFKYLNQEAKKGNSIARFTNEVNIDTKHGNVRALMVLLSRKRPVQFLAVNAWVDGKLQPLDPTEQTYSGKAFNKIIHVNLNEQLALNIQFD